jgi:hypothetical protein
MFKDREDGLGLDVSNDWRCAEPEVVIDSRAG